MSGKLKILVSAYACEPGRGSEPGVGWNWARHFAREHDTWIITRANNRPAIEAALAREPLENAHFIYYDLPRWARFWKHRSFGLRPYYYLWQAGAMFAAKRVARDVHFDLAHHVTFVKYWTPSFISLLGTPFVWGPVGGGESAPRAFRSGFSMRGKLYDAARSIARGIGSADPFVALTARKATVGLATTEDTAARLRALGCRDVRIFPEAALNEEDLARLSAASIRREARFRMISLGNLIHLKAFDLSLRAFALFLENGGTGEYWLVGDGPERRRLEALATKLGIAASVRFLGMQGRAKALELLAQCDVLAHPTLHDSGGWTCLEAMAAAKPVVCLELGGPAVQVIPEAGFRISPTTPEAAITEMASAIGALASDQDLRARMGTAGRAHVLAEFRWANKPARLLRICGLGNGNGVAR